MRVKKIDRMQCRNYRRLHAAPGRDAADNHRDCADHAVAARHTALPVTTFVLATVPAVFAVKRLQVAGPEFVMHRMRDARRRRGLQCRRTTGEYRLADDQRHGNQQ